MAHRRKESPTLEEYWRQHPNGSHPEAVAYTRKKHPRVVRDRILKTSWSVKARLNQPANPNGRDSHLTIERRKRTKAANAEANQRRDPRERNDTSLLRAYWTELGEDGNHDDAMQRCIDAGVKTCIEHSYQICSKVRAGGYANGNGNGNRIPAATPAAAALDTETDATDTAADGNVSMHLSRVKALIAEAEELKENDPFKAPAPMEEAMHEIKLSIDGMAAAMANA